MLTVDYQTANGTLFCGDSLEWLPTLASESADVIFADPPYNLKKAEWDTFASAQAYVTWSLTWIVQAARILKPTGCLYIMGFSETLADLKLPASQYFRSCRWLIWHYKNKANLGNDWGRSHESILVLRKSATTRINVDRVRIPYGNHTLKYPAHPQAMTSQYGNGQQRDHWVPHPDGAKPKDVIEIPTTCNGMPEKTKHPTQKPEELMRKLIFAASNPGDLIIDPFSGSGTTLVVAEQSGRQWLGCELSAEYNQWAIDRLKKVSPATDEEWIAFDRKNAARRQKIR